MDAGFAMDGPLNLECLRLTSPAGYFLPRGAFLRRNSESRLLSILSMQSAWRIRVGRMPRAPHDFTKSWGFCFYGARRVSLKLSKLLEIRDQVAPERTSRCIRGVSG
jgi:hypothetical protein